MRSLAQLVSKLLLVGLMLHSIWWIIGAGAAAWLIWFGMRVYRHSVAAAEAERRRQDEIRAGANQHDWVMHPRIHLPSHRTTPV
jgi:hypothetical protein